MNITIRPARLSDKDIIADFNAAIARETEHVELNRERLIAGIEALLSDHAKGFYLLAESSGRVVGQTMITYEWSDWRNGTFWWIQSVYVHPDFRKGGVFTQLFRRIEKEAKQRADVCGLRLYVERRNARAQLTYEKLGMKKTIYDLYESDFVLHR
ncbi:MAG: GNAT family N-acetyltransferase [Bacteroidota bacterium]|nr:GNAT family N-acetyltransferase [Bacteroidota bacterium]